MSTYGFTTMLAPASVAVVGAGERDGSVGRAVIESLRAGGFPGPIYPVNPYYAEVAGVRCYPDLASPPETPGLVLIATPPETVPAIVEAAGARGAAAAVILSARLGKDEADPVGAARRAARRHSLRLVGPESVGLSVPAAGLNATLLAHPPKPGDLALVSQSGTVASAVAEWAGRRGVGFSAVIGLGRSADVDVADCLDHFATDWRTRAILLSLGRVADARKFLSAARAAARAKPVIVLRAGRRTRPDGPESLTHAGALAQPDAVYEAAFRRAGLLAVDSLDAMFSAVETLGRQRPFPGNRLMIAANGRGIGALAADRLADRDGRLAEPSNALLAELAPLRLSGSTNPFDLGIDACPEDFETALDPLLKDRGSDAVLALHVPTARAAAVPVAESIAAAVTRARKQGSRKPVFAVSIGEDTQAAHILAQARVPLFATEADAVEGFLHVVRYREAQDDLMRTPDALPHGYQPDLAAAKAVVERARAAGQSWLDPQGVEALLCAYAIPIVHSALAPDAGGAASAAWPLIAQGKAVVLKLVSPDIVHKTDVGGVRLSLTSEASVREAAVRMVARARKARPDARITGFAVQPMVARGNRRELIAGLADDPVFGPVVVFGRGGRAVEVIDDRVICLPPLDLALAADMIARTRVARRLAAYRDVPAADAGAIALVLVKLAQLAADLPEVREVDINPLLADAEGVLAVDARVRIAPETGRRRGAWHPRFAIRPYPAEWERELTIRGCRVRVRPVRPEDEPLFAAFFARADPEDVRLRFFAPVREFSHAFLARMTQLDYSRAIAFVALGTEDDAEALAAGTDPDDRAGPPDPTPHPEEPAPARSSPPTAREALAQNGDEEPAPARSPPPTPYPEAPARSGGLEGDLQTPPRVLEPSFGAAPRHLGTWPRLEDPESPPAADSSAAAPGRDAMLGAVRLVSDADHETGEFAIYVRADIQRAGLGEALMRLMIEWARAEGITRIDGSVLAENRAMLALCRHLGFETRADREEAGVVKVQLQVERAGSGSEGGAAL